MTSYTAFKNGDSCYVDAQTDVNKENESQQKQMTWCNIKLKHSELFNDIINRTKQHY